MRPLRMLFMLLSGLLSVSPAGAQMIPLKDQREINASATFLGVTKSLTESPAAPFATFNSFVRPFVPNPDPDGPGSCQAAAFQVSQFFPAGINASGTTSGSWNVLDAGVYSGLSRARFEFRTTTSVAYQLDVWMDPGDAPPSGEFLLEAMPSHVKYHDLATGELHVSGRLSPGDYAIEGVSSFTTSIESFQGATYSYIWTCAAVTNPIIRTQPIGITVPCGTTAQFTVGTFAPTGSLTFQWRRNGVALADNGHFGGVTTPTLSIDAACDPDADYYDVVVGDGSSFEPSTPARLAIGSTSDVGPSAAGLHPFRLELAGPSPFTGRSSFRYFAGESRPGGIAIYDLSGARVRTLSNRLEAGSRVVSWDGTTDAGAHAPAGVYFVRIDAGPLHDSRRVVMLR